GNLSNSPIQTMGLPGQASVVAQNMAPGGPFGSPLTMQQRMQLQQQLQQQQQQQQLLQQQQLQNQNNQGQNMLQDPNQG
ncbi:hypothetical protein BGZ52_003189, partial [Haplosporangium bisporale]